MRKYADTLTIWKDPGYKMKPGSHGKGLTYLQWCRAECDRIARTGVSCGIVWSESGCCAVAELRAVCDESH